jgi:hypothetical protein
MTLFGIQISYLSGIFITVSAAVLYAASIFFFWSLARVAAHADRQKGYDQ